jgi:hypothetical protein
MSYGGAAAAGGASAAAAIAQAIKASGVVVRLDPQDFETILSRADAPLVVCAEGGLFSTNYQYLTSYKGLAFFTKSNTQVMIPSHAEVVIAKKIWIPG